MTQLEALENVTEELILARLLVASAKQGFPKDLKAQVVSLLPDRLTTGELDQLFNAALSRLKSSGDLLAKPWRLSPAVHERALQAWGISKLPPRANWNTLKQQVILPKLLGIPAERIAKAKSKSQALALCVLQRKFGLPPEASSPGKLVDALAWQTMDIESTARFSSKAVVAQRLLGQKAPENTDTVIKRLATQALGQQSNDLFRTAIQRALADRLEHAPEPALSVSEKNGQTTAAQEDTAARFATQVRHAASHSPTGRFGDNKVFISHVWKAFEAEPDAPRLSLERFKEQLLEAHRRQSIELARADLVERMNPEDVVASEVRYLGSTFHFIRLDA